MIEREITNLYNRQKWYSKQEAELIRKKDWLAKNKEWTLWERINNSTLTKKEKEIAKKQVVETYKEMELALNQIISLVKVSSVTDYELKLMILLPANEKGKRLTIRELRKHLSEYERIKNREQGAS